MCFRVAEITKKPVDVVLKEYKANKRRGWGVIAKNLGIKPGSKEFHELKKSKLSSRYHRSGKGKGKDKGKGKGKGKDKDWIIIHPITKAPEMLGGFFLFQDAQSLPLSFVAMIRL